MTDEVAVESGPNLPVDLKNRKICIGFPSSDLVSSAFLNALIQIITQSSQFVPLGLTNAVSSRIAVNRNMIVQHARQLEATDILWIDADSVFPVHSLVKLLMHDKDIVCATTCRRKGTNREPVATPVDFQSIEPNQILVPMKTVGFPFMLTSMKVFDKLDELGLAPNGSYFAEPSRWMMHQNGWEIEGDDALVGEDEYWCYLVRKAGFDILCDMELSMEIGHVGTDIFYIENSSTPTQARVDEVL